MGGNLSDLTKRRQILALNISVNDGINRDRFHCKNFPKIHTFRPAKKSTVNSEWRIPLIM